MHDLLECKIFIQFCAAGLLRHLVKLNVLKYVHLEKVSENDISLRVHVYVDISSVKVFYNEMSDYYSILPFLT